jgi:hypothetical protein
VAQISSDFFAPDTLVPAKRDACRIASSVLLRGEQHVTHDIFQNCSR